MPDFNYGYQQNFVLNFRYDSVVANTVSPKPCLVRSERFSTRTRVRKFFDFAHIKRDAFLNLLVEFFELF